MGVQAYDLWLHSMVCDWLMEESDTQGVPEAQILSFYQKHNQTVNRGGNMQTVGLTWFVSY